MKIALLHYWLTCRRGGENVLAEFCRLFPRADLFTHAWNPDAVGDPFTRHCVRETWIAKLPGGRRHTQCYLPLMPLALRSLDLHEYDLIISSESGPVKGVRKPAGAIHVCYCHTPMRYLWDLYEDYYRQAGPAGKLAMALWKRPLRQYDLRSAASVDHFIANSEFVAERIRRIYHRDSVVIPPPVDVDYFRTPENTREDFYLWAGQLVAYKHPELAVAACRKLNRPLVVVGEGPMRRQLESLGGKNVCFVGRVSREELRRYYACARALLFPGVEDFGIVLVEAQAAGTPVIALGQGGACETVLAGETGVLYAEPTVAGLCRAIAEFEQLSFDPKRLIAHAETFAESRFHERIMSFFAQVAPAVLNS